MFFTFFKGLKPDPYINLVEWSNTYRQLPKESSVEPGTYRTSRTPYVEEILMELSPQSSTQQMVVLKATQIGFTEVGNNFLFAIAHIYPGPSMFAMPTDDMARRHSKKKIAPSIRNMPCLKGIIKTTNKRDGGNTMLLKEFPGGSWTFTGSNSPASARSDSIRYLVLDDLDGFVQDAGLEGAPHDLLKKRTDAFGTKRKIYMNSTPTIKGTSHIEKEWEESSQGEFCVPCPHCSHMQTLVFGGPDSELGIRFTRDEDGQIIDVWYECENCHDKIEEWQKTEMMKLGKYEHKYPDRKKRGFRVNSLYSPLGWLSWEQVADEFLKAAISLKRGNSQPMKVWTNTRMAETWEEDGEQPEWTKLSARAEPYRVTCVPTGGLLLTAGVDTQDNRLEVVVMAYGRGEECWSIYAGTLYGDPDLPEVWNQLDELLHKTYEHESGAELHITSMGIDTGGHKTQAVYNYCRTRAPFVFALKGSSSPGKAVLGPPTKQDFNWKGDKIKRGVALVSIGTDIAKGTIYNRLKLSEPGPGYYHFPIGLDDEFYKQLTAEKLVNGYNKQGFKVSKWIKTRERNDILDCFVYGYAAAIKAGLSHRNWDMMESEMVKHKESKDKGEISKKHETKPKRQPLSGRNLNPWNR